MNYTKDGGSTTADWQEKGWDFVSAGTAITEERQEFAVFSSSYAGTAQSLMCRDDSGFNSIDDVDKTTVKVSAKKRWIRQGRAEEFGFKNVVGVYTIEESYQKMMNGEVDCFIAYENLLMPNMTRAVITAQLYSVDYGVWELVDVDAGLPRVLQGDMLDELNRIISMYKPPSLPSTWAAKQWVIGSTQIKIDMYERDFWDFVKANIPGFFFFLKFFLLLSFFFKLDKKLLFFHESEKN